jgi:pimeloyl-ACP methyl ester carboxylesterase
MLGSSRETKQALPDVMLETIYRMFHLPTYRAAWLSFLETVLTLRGSSHRYQLGPDDLSCVAQAVLFVWGANDPFGGVGVGQQAVKAMPDARLHVIDGGHVPYIDSPKECAQLIREFLPRGRGGVATSCA